MTFKQRNSIILGAQTLLIGIVGVYLLARYYPKKFDLVRKDLEHCDKTLSELHQRESYLNELNLKVDENRAALAGWNKVVEANISMGDILDFLNKIQQQHGSFKFSLAFQRDVHSADYSYKVFNLSGEGDWESIFALVWILENGPKIFAIEKLELRGVETMEEDDEAPFYSRFKMVIPFNMQVKAVYSNGVTLADLPVNTSADYLVQLPVGKNIFYPAIIHNLPPNEYGLLEVERAELKALFPGKAIIADNQGTIHSLLEGDPVYLGYLLKINQPQNAVEFLLNKGGIVEKFSLKLMLGGDSDKQPGS